MTVIRFGFLLFPYAWLSSASVQCSLTFSPTCAHAHTRADEMDTFKSPPPREDEMSQVSEFESDDAPSAPPLSPRMYPDLPSSDTEREIGVNFQVPVIPVTPLRFRSDINQQRVRC